MVNHPIATDAREFLASCSKLINSELDRLIPNKNKAPNRLHRAIRWSVFAGGKRLRPALVFAAGQTFGARLGDLLCFACAIEMIHTYSLIHDDLPSMDDDELRRGRATCHVKFDEATAILAGDSLLTLAFQILTEDEIIPPDLRVQLIGELARAAGTPKGMVAGQALDLMAATHNTSNRELDLIHRLKTVALIRVAVRCGAIIGGARSHELEALTEYATNLGLLFQITDDLLDVTATSEDLGKTPGKDARSQKATYFSLHGRVATRSQIKVIHRAACDALDQIERPTDLLRSIAGFILNRKA